jgi:hypothetical protein
MNRWRVGDDRGSKEKDRCPLTQWRGPDKNSGSLAVTPPASSGGEIQYIELACFGCSGRQMIQKLGAFPV